jgi:hypothetical protein
MGRCRGGADDRASEREALAFAPALSERGHRGFVRIVSMRRRASKKRRERIPQLGGAQGHHQCEITTMSFHDEYRIVINEAQRRLIMRALTNALAYDRRSTGLSHPTPDEWMQIIRLFSTIEPPARKP